MHSSSVAGPPWRWEVSTCGPFCIETFETTGEVATKVMEEFRSM